jgi:hypothetical protein
MKQSHKPGQLLMVLIICFGFALFESFGFSLKQTFLFAFGKSFDTSTGLDGLGLFPGSGEELVGVLTGFKQDTARVGFDILQIEWFGA